MASTRQVQPTDSLGDQKHYGQYSEKQPTLFHFLRVTYNRVALSWHRIQIGNRASYSVERVLAFRDYCARTSPVRAFAVCILTPVPATIVMLLIECIPLRPPEEGWKANYTMWIRVLVTAFFVGGGIVFLATAIISEARISTIRALCITMVSAVCYTALGVFLAAMWRYPIPFGMVLMVCPFVTIIFTLVLLSINPQELKTNAKLQKQVIGHIVGASAQSLLVVAYPTFSAVFLQLSGVQQAIFMLVLPVIKFSTKQIIAHVATHLEDYVGAVIVFSVDVFNVLYVAICMQTARSSLTTMLIMSSDILHILASLRTIYYHTHAKLEQSEQQKENHNYVDKIVSSLAGWKPRARPNSRAIRLRGPYKLPLSVSSEDFLESLDNHWNIQQAACSTRETAMEDQSIPSLPALTLGPSNQLIPRPLTKTKDAINPRQKSGNATGRRVTPIHPSNSVVPQEYILQTSSRSKRIIKTSDAPTLSNSQRSTRRGVGVNSARTKIVKTIQQELQVLFHCEYVILSEYIEFVLPLLYAGYLAGLYRLPTAAYYPFTRSLTPTKMNSTLIQLVIYGSLEFASFAGLHILLKKRLGYSPAYQLAFVLETHAVLIQSLLFIWVPFIVQLTLVHVGVDFNAPFQ